MKKIMLLCLTAGLFFACGEEKKEEKKSDKNEEKEEQAEVTPTAVMLRGVDFDTTTVLTPNEMMLKMDGLDSLEGVVLRTKINECCKKKGCWMTLNMGEDNPEMRVWFKDYDFFVPLDGDGTEVVISGKAYYSEVSVKDQQHILEDANASKEEIAAITEPKVELGFEATGVYLYGYKGEEVQNEKD